MNKVLFCLYIIVIVSLAVVLLGKDFRSAIPVALTEKVVVEKTNPFNNMYSTWVDSVFNRLTLDQRIGQLFFADVYSNQGKSHVDAITALINNHHIGGLIFFHGGPISQAVLTNKLQEISKTPLLVSIDAEWGLGMRLDSCVSFPRQMTLGAIKDIDLIRQMGVEIGQQCRRMGIHISFSPLADVNNNPLNPVIGNRSFGENSHDVAKRALAYMTGLQEQRILTTAKHFPGHGNTTVDSHHALPVVTESYARLDSLEWYPYKEMIRNYLTGIMVAHIHVPELDNTPNLAASLSRRVITDILRDSLNFCGLIYTDALNMKGVTNHFEAGELEVMAIEAGADVLLMSADIPKAIDAVKTAINTGRIDKEQVEMSCRRILAAKEWAGLNKYKPVNTNGLIERLNSPETDLLNRRLVEASLTVVQNRDSIIPLKRLDKEKTAVLLTGVSQENSFLNTLNLYEENDYYFLPRGVTSQHENVLLNDLKIYSRVIVGIHNTNSNPAANYGILPNFGTFVDRLADSTNVILCLFASPYALSSFKNKTNMAAIVVGYQGTSLVQDYMAQLLYGAIAGKGILPIYVDYRYRYGTGVYTMGGLRFKYSIPEEVQVFSQKLQAIDGMVRNAINEKAFPGCQILAARNGVVFFKKEYGNTRYDNLAELVEPNHIYDLASVSKVAATMPPLMLFNDEELFKLEGKLADYLPELRNSNKANITMIDLLTHQSQLPSHIAFHLRTMEPIDSEKKLLEGTYSALHSIYLGPRTYLNSQHRFKEGYYATKESDSHKLQVADSMFVVGSYRDSIIRGIRNVRLLARKQYTYSDLGFILLGNIIERLSEKQLDEFVTQRFYAPLGATTLRFNPLKYFKQERIIPTSNDTVFRKQWLQGYVHDENAALMGGISGHAGLFGNANDLAKLMQMFLNMGTYGGERYINEETIKEFISSPFVKKGNRRGLGFDKPEPAPRPNDLMTKNASASSFGHTGFTGTMVWMDPKNGLLFVFLSNRVCPNATNNKLSSLALRAKIYEVLAKAIAID